MNYLYAAVSLLIAAFLMVGGITIVLQTHFKCDCSQQHSEEDNENE